MHHPSVGEDKWINDPQGGVVKGSTAPKSLMISPNLEALIEHEERTRPRQANGTYGLSSPSRTMTPNVISPTDEVAPISLPPPPRAVRRKRPPAYLPALDVNGGQLPLFPLLSESEEGPQTANHNKMASIPNSPAIAATSTSTPNPYINPAPSLEDILLAEKQLSLASQIRPSAQPPTPNSDKTREEKVQNERPKIDTVSLPRRPVRDEGPLSPSDGKTSAPTSPKQPQGPETSQQSASPTAIHFKYPTLPRVEKLVPIQKNTFYHPLAESESPKFQADGPLVTSVRPLSPKSPSGRSSRIEGGTNLRQRARNRGKLLKLSRGSAVEEMREIEMFACRDSDERAADQGYPWRRRPLLSHAKSLSRSSGSSMLSDSTHNPPSTVEQEPRISISSTIYPSSSSHSHGHSVLNDVNHDLILPPTSTQDRQSFIEIYTPFNQEFPAHEPPKLNILTQIQTEQLIDSDNYQLMSILSGSPISKSSSRSPKPPIPTTPKPLFMRKPIPSSKQSSPTTSPATSIVFEGYRVMDDPPPPTTNWLDQSERADLIRKSRKLARVFGRTPGADVMAQQDCSRPGQLLSSPLNLPHHRLRHQRTALSTSNDIDNSGLRQRRSSAWSSPAEPHFPFATGRRHSMPLSPDDVSFISITSPIYEAGLSDLRIEVGSLQTSLSSDLSAHHATNQKRTESRTSFIDLSEEERADDALPINRAPKKVGIRRPTSPSAQSLFENITPEKRLEEDRRRKRERLAKLHRFLGSQVPAHLVLGLSDPESSLPPASQLGSEASSDMDDVSRKVWLRRRRSSSAAAVPSNWSDDLDRMKEDLNDKEKAINVRRAQKMEKVFGVAPPQTLYHTRHSPSPSLPPATLATIPNGLSSPTGFIPTQDPVFFTRNPNRSAYEKPNPKKNNRPGTSESNKQLLPKNRRMSSGYDDHADGHQEVGSIIYHHYQHSLNSLNDILDRDDHESLVELHHHLKADNDPKKTAEALQDFSRTIGHRRPSIASVKSERRRSLPARTSMTSLISEYTISTPKPDVTDFQLRRRRAAKLTQFFGVHYRELIIDVLESIENGLEHERNRGTLQAEEVEDLLQRLRSLKVRREGLL